MKTHALITDMNEPLASAAGNALEVANAAKFLTGAEIDPRLWDVTVALGGEGLALAGLAESDVEGRARIAAAFESGRAAEIFGRMTTALGGPADLARRGHLVAPQHGRKLSPTGAEPHQLSVEDRVGRQLP